MASDSIASASFAINSSSNPKDISKKKRANRSAKLKQCKKDARREQWLSQVKNKGCKGGAEGQGGTVDVGIEKGKTIVKLEIKPREDVDAENEGFINNFNSDTESPANSPTSHSGSVLDFIGSSSSSSGRCCLGSMSGEDEERDDECLDDWENFDDAWPATDKKQEPEHDILNSPQESHANASFSEMNNNVLSGADVSHQKQERGSVSKCRAWRPDDAFRPQSLPNLSKQFSFPMDTDHHSTVSELTSCPICTEDFDATDTSFLPCFCGYRLCLFCYKRILEYNDARCPGCRKQYDSVPVNGDSTLDGGSWTIRLARSCSMVSRS